MLDTIDDLTVPTEQRILTRDVLLDFRYNQWHTAARYQRLITDDNLGHEFEHFGY